MWKILSILIIAITSTQVSAQSCDALWLTADYDIKHSTQAGNEQHTKMTVWRKPEHVAHQYAQTQITEMWQFVRQGMLKPTRYFDEHKRAIEYQPNELVHGKRETDWSYRNQLVSNQLIDSMNKVDERDSGCMKVVTYKKTLNGNELVLEWLPAYKLPLRFQRKDNQGNSIVWQQQSLTKDSDKVAAFFERRDNYKATDYADIGDDHTDPFLTNMVTQGFIEQGASGFYDTKGRAIKSEHTH
ncbi:hypothetical protein U0358_08385 [Idiomarina sp. PL1-037]|uniref:hypothetical protein n=1 Tax=Idiomarina TaxID=135575 RepID=UPI00294B8FD3|nr:MULTISPECIES: hypothetical protein [unclassified Idiomarina]MDV6328829.1 hypothetical protein [Idiomarina sp. Sol25]WQC52077.1 hypothetical protein U0358_08385 [Idiomarina sp. PL1-037]